MTFKNAREYKDIAVNLLKENEQHAAANAVEIAFRTLLLTEQYKFERDIAVEQLENLGICLGEETKNYVCISKEYYDELLECKNKYNSLCKIITG